MSLSVKGSLIEPLYPKLNSEVYNKSIYTKQFPLKQVDEYCNNVTYLNTLKKMIYEHGYIVLHFTKQTSITDLKKWLNLFLGKSVRDSGLKRKYISVITNNPGGKYFANSNMSQPIHTDEGHALQFPRIVCLYFKKQSEQGGDSILVPFPTLYNDLRCNFPNDFEQLFEPDSIHAKNYKEDVKKSLLITLPEKRVGITYSPLLFDLKCSKKVKEMYQYITEYIHEPTNQIRIKLQENQLLIIDNCRMLHGRTKFQDDSKRVLYRMWFSGQ